MHWQSGNSTGEICDIKFLPITPGGYILELFLAHPVVLQVGRLGGFSFPAGAYLYFGSACGPGGLRARLSRHLLPANSHSAHWHIDYLRASAEARALGYLAYPSQEQSAPRLECLWSQAVAGFPGSLVPAPGFGASDCHSGCPAHLALIHRPEASGKPVLLEPGLQNILASTASLIQGQQIMGWLEINQSQIAPGVSAKTAGT